MVQHPGQSFNVILKRANRTYKKGKKGGNKKGKKMKKKQNKSRKIKKKEKKLKIKKISLIFVFEYASFLFHINLFFYLMLFLRLIHLYFL